MEDGISFKKTVKGSVEGIVTAVTALLKAEGFSVLTRIDMHAKFKEKLGKDIAPVVILGACNAALAYEAYTLNTDVTALLPCNAVVRDIGGGKVSVELAKPTALMEFLGDKHLEALAVQGDERLLRVLENLPAAPSKAGR